MSKKESDFQTIETPTADESAAYGGEAAPVDEAEKLRGELKESRDRWLRTQAELQNVTRRLTEEKQNAVRFANADFARSLLPVIDNFERTMASLQEHHHDDAVIQGVKLVYELFQKTLRENHITAIEALHKPFDPSKHEALRREETSEFPEGTVVAEYERGYMLFDRVLRASKVALAAAPAK